MFVDRARITIKSGKGGNGAVTFRKEPFVPEGGPDGGDGGKGGDVIFLADSSLRTLMDFRYKRKYEAESGQDGMRRKRFGKKGEDLIIKVPPGTIIIDEETGLAMKDLINDGDKFIVAKGGKGGKGNVHFKNSVRQAPNFAESGGFAKERNVILEMKLIADVGLVGFPNVGKSTILSVTTNSNPKVANYHFTTIKPNLGVVSLFNDGFVIADIAGIIEGAHKGAGLGHFFLKHIERTKVLIHVVDVSGSEGRNPIEDFEKINNELKLYNPYLSKKPQIVAANKIDMIDLDDDIYVDFKKHVEDKGMKVFPISAPINEGLYDLLVEANKMLEEVGREDKKDLTIEFFDFSSEEYEEDFKEIYISKKEEGVYELQGKQLRKIFDSTNFNDGGSLRYLQKYIEKKGAIEKMKEMGMEDGDIVKIFDYEFEYYDEY